MTILIHLNSSFFGKRKDMQQFICYQQKTINKLTFT